MSDAVERFQFGRFEIDIRTGELFRSGVALRLAPQPFRVLALLVRRHGELVTREEIQEAIWSDGTTVEFDQGLNYCIRQIRMTLEEDAKAPQFIETVPKRGYRFTSEVTPVEPKVASVSEAASPILVATSQSPSWVRLALFAALLVVGVATAAYLGQPRSHLPTDPEVARIFKEAEHLSTTWENEKTQKSMDLYRQVIAKEPGFADAYAGLANALVIGPFMGSREGVLDEAETVAQQAIRLDDSLPLAHAALGHCYWHQWKWAEAEAEFQKALAIDPDAAIPHQLYGLYLASVGRSEEAIQHGRRAAEIAPTSGVILFSLAQIYLQSGHLDESIAQNRHTLTIYRHFPNSYLTLMRAFTLKGSFKEAEDVYREWSQFSPVNNLQVNYLNLLVRTGRVAEARAGLDAIARGESKGGRGIPGVSAFIALGDHATALDILEENVRRHLQAMIWLKVAPELRPLHSEPRYRALLARMGLQ